MAPHIVSAFESDLQELRARLSEMGGLAEEQLSESLDAVRRRDLPLARRVITKDLELDQREIALEELAVRTLALRQPLAQDLRETIAALKIASTLGRTGDLTKSIAKRVSPMSETDLAAMGGERLNNWILGMGQLAQTQLSDVLDAYGARDTAAAVNVWRRDVEIDELYNSLFRELIDLMTRERGAVSHGAHLMFVAKNLERIGDHATFIAEMTYYVVIGQPLSDDRPKGDPLFPLPEVDSLTDRETV